MMSKKMIFSIILYVMSFIFMVIASYFILKNSDNFESSVFIVSFLVVFSLMLNLLFILVLWVYEHWVYSLFSMLTSITSFAVFILMWLL